MKIGGINHVIVPQSLPFIQPQTTMLVGVDVSHQRSMTMAEAPSVVGIVASLDDNFTKWYGTTCVQKAGVEMVEKIGELMGERLSLYGRTYKKYPENIIIYRDGKFAPTLAIPFSSSPVLTSPRCIRGSIRAGFEARGFGH